MRIGIDARFIGPQGTGLGKYTEKLIISLAKIDNKNQYIIFLGKNNWDYLKLKNNFKKVLSDISWYSILEQIKLPSIFKKQDLDLLHVPHFNVPIAYHGKFIVTIHDLIHHQFSESSATTNNPIVFKIKRFAYRKVISHAIRQSAKVLTPSNFIKDEIVKTFNVEPLKIVVTYEAAEEEYFKTSNFELRTSNFPEKEPFLVYVGNAYPHKNLERLLDAIKILTDAHSRGVSRRISAHPGGESGLKLVLVCPRDVFSKRLENQIKSRKLENQVEVKGYLPAKELVTLFQKASVYIFPSLSEGFGIPGLNAMTSGLPVVCSNIPTLKEVYKDAALYFDPQDPQDISSKINLVLRSDLKTRSDLIKKGFAQSKKYSWLQMAKETLAVYKSSTQ